LTKVKLIKLNWINSRSLSFEGIFILKINKIRLSIKTKEFFTCVLHEENKGALNYLINFLVDKIESSNPVTSAFKLFFE